MRSYASQHGVSLLEALVAALVLSFGMLAFAKWQVHGRLEAQHTRHYSEASQIAQADIESARTGADPTNTERPVAPENPGTEAFRLRRRFEPLHIAGAHDLQVSVGWLDRTGSLQQLQLSTIVASTSPLHGGALGLARGAAASVALGRSRRIPVLAVDLGNGRSVFKPLEDGTVAIVFDNLSGDLVGRCGAIDPALRTHDLQASQLLHCDAIPGMWLSGFVRFSLDSPADATHPASPPLPFSIEIHLKKKPGNGEDHEPPAPPSCIAGTVSTGGPDPHAVYHCAVYPRAAGRWSGEVTLRPTDWQVGTAPDKRRVCRYVADLDASGAIDRNLEHPAVYTDVDENLPNQNFLVVAGPEACPVGRPRPGGNNGGSEPLPATEPHQP